MVIFHALKDKWRVLVLRKGYHIWVEREISGKWMRADEGFCGKQGQSRGLGQPSQWRTWRVYMESSYLHTAPVSLCKKGLHSSFHPWSTPHWNSSWLPWLPGYLMMIAWNGLTRIPASEFPIYTFSGQWGATPFNLIVQLGTPPANGGFGVLDITMYHCAHQHGLVGVEGGHDTTFSPLTPLCVWFWDVVIQGHGVSSHDPQTLLQCPVFFDLYVPLQHSCLLHTCMNFYQTLFTPNLFHRVI